jgi:NAD(P)-dependent dehydrogenase (short-subunit alcohol dehydrogenase family)
MDRVIQYYGDRPPAAARVDSPAMSIPKSPRAIVTGAGSGLGRALSLALAKRGGKVLVADIDLTSVEETAQAVVAAGGQAVAQKCDVSKVEEVEKLAELADTQFGGSDLIANNAGVGVGGPMGDVSLRDWEWIMNINLWGVIYGCHVFAPRFKRQRSGHILNIASAAGLLCAPDMAPYNVTKAGVVALSETLCAELRPFSVGVTVVCPTFFKTQIADKSRFTGPSERLVEVAKKQMERSTVQAGDVANSALTACEEDTLYCVPMADARWGWWLKRLAPDSFYKRVLPAAIKGVLR